MTLPHRLGIIANPWIMAEVARQRVLLIICCTLSAEKPVIVMVTVSKSMIQLRTRGKWCVTYQSLERIMVNGIASLRRCIIIIPSSWLNSPILGVCYENGYLFVLGGEWGNTYTPTIDVFCFVTGKWYEMGMHLDVERSHAAVVMAYENPE